MKKISEFLFENFQFLVVKFSIYLDRCVFVMLYMYTCICKLIDSKRNDLESNEHTKTEADEVSNFLGQTS